MEWSRKDVPEGKYAITKEDEIVLYGNNAYCEEQIENLREEGYQIRGVIDENAKCGERTATGIPIYRNVEEICLSEKTCIFIMLQNGMLHWEIARSLYRHGAGRIVFLPLRTGFYNREVQNEFVIQYNYMMEKKYMLMRVPYLQDEMFEQIDERRWFEAKRLQSGDSIIWLSADLIRTAMQEVEEYRDIPIGEFTPYINLFNFLKGDQVDISEYIREYGKTPFSETSKEAYDYVFNKRHVLYDFFEEQFRSGNMDYFTASAPVAVWNEKGYVNLCEGQHRCVYLLSKGMKYVPVRVEQKVLNRIAAAV